MPANPSPLLLSLRFNCHTLARPLFNLPATFMSCLVCRPLKRPAIFVSSIAVNGLQLDRASYLKSAPATAASPAAAASAAASKPTAATATAASAAPVISAAPPHGEPATTATTKVLVAGGLQSNHTQHHNQTKSIPSGVLVLSPSAVNTQRGTNSWTMGTTQEHVRDARAFHQLLKNKSWTQKADARAKRTGPSFSLSAGSCVGAVRYAWDGSTPLAMLLLCWAFSGAG